MDNVTYDTNNYGLWYTTDGIILALTIGHPLFDGYMWLIISLLNH